METIKYSQITNETKKLNNLFKKHGRFSEKLINELEQMGFQLFILGVAKSKLNEVGQVGKKYFDDNDTEYFGISENHIKNNAYYLKRAYIKLLTN
jgi:hypothetical protein